MMTMFELELIATQRHQELAEELDRAYEGGVPRGASIREVVAGALIAVAVWLAPSARGAVAGQVGQVAHSARA
jgi:hypothetical protein